ncbi:hypothetical protein [Thermus oshimai]
MGEKGRLLKVEEVWALIGRDRVGREALYRFCREHGIRMGKRLLVPSVKVEALLEGRLDALEDSQGR